MEPVKTPCRLASRREPRSSFPKYQDFHSFLLFRVPRFFASDRANLLPAASTQSLPVPRSLLFLCSDLDQFPFPLLTASTASSTTLSNTFSRSRTIRSPRSRPASMPPPRIHL